MRKNSSKLQVTSCKRKTLGAEALAGETGLRRSAVQGDI